MGTFRPVFQQQGPAGNCVINGKNFGWLSCTAYATAMLIDRSTLGKNQPSGCTIRKLTGDTVGGTKLTQCAAVARSKYNVPVEVHSGSGVCKPAYAMGEMKKGRSIVLQGNCRAMLGTTYQSTNGPVNHAIFLNEGRGWDDDSPEEVLVYDPAADGRRSSIDQGPTWWPYSLVLKFAASLEPAGDGTARLGPGKWYCAIGPDTEPHILFRYGGVKTSPFPDRTRAAAKKSGGSVNVHSSPTTGASSTVDKLADNELFIAYQYTDKGTSFEGSTRWFGDQTGRLWVHSKRLSHEGGTT